MIIKPPLAIGASYRKELRKLNKQLQDDVNKVLLPALKRLQSSYTKDSYADELLEIIEGLKERWSAKNVYNMIGSRFVKAVNVNSEKQFKKFGIDVQSDDPKISDFLESSITSNTSLIKNIQSETLSKIEALVLNNTNAGLRHEAIAKKLKDQFDMSDKRAKLIARDQTAKIAGNLNERRQRSVGFVYFRWLDSGDSRVRDRHEDIANKVTAYGKGVYRWDYPPLNEKGEEILPGQDYQCRCTAIPVSQVEVDRNVKAGRTQPGVKR